MRKRRTNRLYDQRTVWPMRRETSVTPELGGYAVPSELNEVTSQRITLLSADALSRPLPSGVNNQTRGIVDISVQAHHQFLCAAIPHTNLLGTTPRCNVPSIWTESNGPRIEFEIGYKLIILEDPSRSLHILTVLPEQVATH